MKTTIKYSHGKGFSRNISSVTISGGARTDPEIQENIEKARSERHRNRQAHQLF